jgi:hypothetical protein
MASWAMKRAGDVLQILLAHIGDDDLNLAADLLVGGGREADAAGLGNAFQPRGDVDAVAENVVAVGEHVADIDTDAELEPPIGRTGDGRGRPALDRDGAANRVDGSSRTRPGCRRP